MIALGARGRRGRSQDIEWRRLSRRFRYSGSGENFLQFAGADDRVHFRNVLSDLIAKTLDQAAGNHEALRLAARLLAVQLPFVTGHFEDGIDGFLLRAADK